LNAGFTLVEALFATLLMAVILGAMATVTAQWLPNWDRGFVRMQRAELLAAGLDRLVADLVAAETVSAAGAGQLPMFDGSELAVTFVRTAIGPNATTGLEVVRIAETSDGRGPALVRATAPFAPIPLSQFVFANPVVVLRSPFRVAFSYAGPDREWKDRWRGEFQLPRAVRVRVRDAATSRTLAASTSTFVGAELPAGCVVAATMAECSSIMRTGSSPGGDKTSAGGTSAGGMKGL
jgi:general secretion pathway protein J